MVGKKRTYQNPEWFAPNLKGPLQDWWLRILHHIDCLRLATRTQAGIRIPAVGIELNFWVAKQLRYAKAKMAKMNHENVAHMSAAAPTDGRRARGPSFCTL